MNASATPEWRDQIFEVLQDHDVKQVYHVPDAGHGRLIEACQRSNSMRTLALTTEEEGIPLAAGAWLGGQRSVLVRVSDAGPGIPAGELPQIFEKFYRRAGSGGAGLGLAICRGLVEAHGGLIWAENRPAGGASFAFTLPLGSA